MDRELWMRIYELLEDLLGDNEPTDEELDYDDNAIEMYEEAHNLKAAMGRNGFGG